MERLAEPQRVTIGVFDFEHTHFNPVNFFQLTRLPASGNDPITHPGRVVRLEKQDGRASGPALPGAVHGAFSLDEMEQGGTVCQLGFFEDAVLLIHLAHLESDEVTVEGQTAAYISDREKSTYRRNDCWPTT